MGLKVMFQPFRPYPRAIRQVASPQLRTATSAYAIAEVPPHGDSGRQIPRNANVVRATAKGGNESARMWQKRTSRFNVCRVFLSYHSQAPVVWANTGSEAPAPKADCTKFGGLQHPDRSMHLRHLASVDALIALARLSWHARNRAEASVSRNGPKQNDSGHPAEH